MKTTQQPIVYDHIISYHLLRRAHTNGYDLLCNINTETHTKTNAFIRKEYVQHAPTLSESNRVAGSIQVLLNKRQIYGGAPKVNCYLDLYVSTPKFAFTQRRVRTPGSAAGPHCK